MMNMNIFHSLPSRGCKLKYKGTIHYSSTFTILQWEARTLQVPIILSLSYFRYSALDKEFLWSLKMMSGILFVYIWPRLEFSLVISKRSNMIYNAKIYMRQDKSVNRQGRWINLVSQKIIGSWINSRGDIFLLLY